MKKGLLTKKEGLFTYTQKIHGKFLRKIAMANSCGKFPLHTATANSHDKKSRQILMAKSHGK